MTPSPDFTKAVEAEIAAVDEKLTELRGSIEQQQAYRERLVALTTDEADRGVPEPAPPSAAPEPTPEPPKASQADDATAAARAGRGSFKAAEGQRNRETVYDAIAAAGEDGTTSTALIQRTGLSRSVIHNAVKHFGAEGKISTERRHARHGGSLYRAVGNDVAPPDGNGARTGAERRIIDALEQLAVPLTTTEVANQAGISDVDAGSMLSALARRGAVRDVGGRDGRRQWELPEVETA